jgi:trimethylamine--corrinoid protein Co-methyltransferase
LDDEMIGLIKQIVAGCQVDEATLAYEVMKQVIPGDGVFLGEMHTVQHMRQGALWMPKLSARGGGAEPVVARARARARQILNSHQVEPLPADAGRHLDEIMARARRELAR